MRIFFYQQEKQSPFSKICKYVCTRPLTRISTSSIMIAFAHYTHTHVSYLNKVNAYSKGKHIPGEEKSFGFGTIQFP